MKLSIIVHPNSKNPRIEEDLLQMTHVYVKSPPLEGKANKDVIEALARHYKVNKSKVVLMRGEKSKSKLFEIG
jgi:hypothetical protein